ncbi:DUF6114 domain-containing protein [Streptomyces sp. NBC_00083]|uniref:DUF6114 domain-containing protein n=1 Tax=Streptomyces sp. NBC_00083 TaxID=2975647 RepID=UPI0022524BED|nr:DUF6114 domain-containing protein [Streptomyces sp. NBC_00083]MCX5385747.1 DUF6114 domain-containing protein [Streptomyces sp. NBC_00083]
MSAETTGSRDDQHWWLRFRAWRGRRPFWAGLFTIIGGVPIMYFPYANMHLGNVTLAMSTTAGAGSLIIGVLLITLGLTMWFHSVVRTFAGIAAILLALISIPIANIGGFVVGFLFSMLGGALACAWVPAKPRRKDKQAESTDVTPAGPAPEGMPEPTAAATETTVDANGGRNSAG